VACAYNRIFTGAPHRRPVCNPADRVAQHLPGLDARAQFGLPLNNVFALKRGWE
jgi:hypothetical protein